MCFFTSYRIPNSTSCEFLIGGGLLAILAILGIVTTVALPEILVILLAFFGIGVAMTVLLAITVCALNVAANPDREEQPVGRNIGNFDVGVVAVGLTVFSMYGPF